jgi:hypothetical protein
MTPVLGDWANLSGVECARTTLAYRGSDLHVIHRIVTLASAEENRREHAPGFKGCRFRRGGVVGIGSVLRVGFSRVRLGCRSEGQEDLLEYRQHCRLQQGWLPELK